jgi:hypothetical protein
MHAHTPDAFTTPRPVHVTASLNSQLVPAYPAAHVSQCALVNCAGHVHPPFASATPRPLHVTALLY